MIDNIGTSVNIIAKSIFLILLPRSIASDFPAIPPQLSKPRNDPVSRARNASATYCRGSRLNRAGQRPAPAGQPFQLSDKRYRTRYAGGRMYVCTYVGTYDSMDERGENVTRDQSRRDVFLAPSPPPFRLASTSRRHADSPGFIPSLFSFALFFCRSRGRFLQAAHFSLSSRRLQISFPVKIARWNPTGTRTQ